MKYYLTILLLPAFLWGQAHFAEAAMYRYKDANGAIRYTDNYTDIPMSQRKGIPFQEEDTSSQTPPPQTSRPAPAAASPLIETDQTPLQTNAANEMSDNARIDQLLKQKTALDAEISQLTKESLAITAEKKNLTNNDQVKTYNEKVEKLNARVADYEKRRALFQKESEAFDAKLKQKMRPTPPTPASPPPPSP